MRSHSSCWPGGLPLLLGLVSVVLSDAESSLGLIWVIVSIIWGAVFIATAEFIRRRDIQSREIRNLIGGIIENVRGPIQQRNNHLYQNLGIIALSILVAILLANSSALEIFLSSIGEKRLIGSFFAGFLFTSVFSAAPAAVLLGELAQANSVWLVALTGALGAVAGDYIIFRFVRDRLTLDMLSLLQQRKRRLKKILRLPSARWVLAIVGFLVVASPLPDELGIALLGFAKTKHRIFFLISFIANFLGILAIGWAANSVN